MFPPRTPVLLALLTVILAAGGFILSFAFPEGEDPEGKIRTGMQECRVSPRPSSCYRLFASELLGRFPLADILFVFAANETKPEFFQQCHEVAHYLGQEEYRKTGNLRGVFGASNHACLAGAFHGGVEGYFMARGIRLGKENFVEIGRAVSEICGDPASYDRPQEFTECNHGLGHAVMYIADYDLPPALALCDELGARTEQELCYTGAFMANANSVASNDHPSRYIRADDPLYPCPILAEQYQRMCYTYAVLARFQYVPEQSVAICNSVPEPYRRGCFETYGRDRTMVTANPRELKNQCALVSNPLFRQDCIRGVAYNLAVRFGIDSDLPFSFCDIVSFEERDVCYRSIARALRKVTPEIGMARSRCNTGGTLEYRAVCLEEISAD